LSSSFEERIPRNKCLIPLSSINKWKLFGADGICPTPSKEWYIQPYINL
jgi:hypothetical protein